MISAVACPKEYATPICPPAEASHRSPPVNVNGAGHPTGDGKGARGSQDSCARKAALEVKADCWGQAVEQEHDRSASVVVVEEVLGSLGVEAEVGKEDIASVQFVENVSPRHVGGGSFSANGAGACDHAIQSEEGVPISPLHVLTSQEEGSTRMGSGVMLQGKSMPSRRT